MGVKRAIHLALCAMMMTIQAQRINAQSSRISYNGQQLFLCGSNIAWVNFARDIGPGATSFASFSDVMLQSHDQGGNVVRWWLHTDGTSTPQFNRSNVVIGPGVDAVADLRQILDLAWERETGVILCLWSFDMLRLSNSPTVLQRNRLLLTDSSYTRAYINNALVPMIDSLRGHPAIVAWEIFNEPEGMSNEFGWSEIQHVPMSAIQRFINLCAGAIHRHDPTSKVTSGAWSFKALTDVNANAPAHIGTALTQAEREQAATMLKGKNRLSLSLNQIIEHLERTSQLTNFNYYSDARLIAAGGDSRGTLDFYSVHYYVGIDPGNPTSISPFHRHASHWQLNKPIVVAELALQNTLGVRREALYETLYAAGYAGALAWSWTDISFSTHSDLLDAMKSIWDNHRNDVDVNGIGGFWPRVAITSPQNDATFTDTTAVTISAAAFDSDGSVVAVQFYASDTLFIGERSAEPYAISWTNIPRGMHSLTATAIDNQGHQRTSNRVRITVGRPKAKRFEAEAANHFGSGMTVRGDNSSSGGAFLDAATNVANAKVTWHIPNVAEAGTFDIAFGYRLLHGSPKYQRLSVNGFSAGEIEFQSSSIVQWHEKTMTVNLLEGRNTIELHMLWGWMHLDYLSAAANLDTAYKEPPPTFSLAQNYPNPFNPSTTIRYALREAGVVTLKVFDPVGREIRTLVHGMKSAGEHFVTFDAEGLASGMYFYRLMQDGKVLSRKMVLMY